MELVGELCHLFGASTTTEKCQVFAQDGTAKCRASGSVITLDSVVAEGSNAGVFVAQ